MVDQLTNLDPTFVTGYAADDRYLATRYQQGGRVVYDFELSLEVVPAILPVPDPHRPTLGNRRVNQSHARSFGKYVRENEDWVAPALLLRAPGIMRFDVLKELGGVQFGIMSIPRSARGDIKIIDGQHRILGLHVGLDEIARELEEQRLLASKARAQESQELVATYQRNIEILERQRERFAQERLAVQVHIETDPSRFEQMFYDVADNALGITQAVKVRFDSRKVVNRTLDAMVKHALLNDRIDMEQDRIHGSNPNLMGAKHVVELVRTVAVGISGRVSRRLEDELDEGALVEAANDFLDTCVAAFPDLDRVVGESLTPEELRKRSLLGSATMLRALAGVFYELRLAEMDDDDIAEFFSRLAPYMVAPITKGSPWLKIEGDVFTEGALAPRSRRQDLKRLTEEIAAWGKNPPPWL
jgi:hypothetical protein